MDWVGGDAQGRANHNTILTPFLSVKNEVKETLHNGD